MLNRKALPTCVMARILVFLREDRVHVEGFPVDSDVRVEALIVGFGLGGFLMKSSFGPHGLHIHDGLSDLYFVLRAI